VIPTATCLIRKNAYGVHIIIFNLQYSGKTLKICNVTVGCMFTGVYCMCLYDSFLVETRFIPSCFREVTCVHFLWYSRRHYRVNM